MSTIFKLSSKLFSFGQKSHQNVPSAMCSSTLIETDPTFRGFKCGTTLADHPGKAFKLLKPGQRVLPADICRLKKQISFAKEMQKIEEDQFEFFTTNSRYLDVDNQILVLFAPDPIVEEQLEIFKREKSVRSQLECGGKSCFKCKFVRRFSKIKKTSKSLELEYSRLKAEYLRIIHDTSDKLRIVAFIAVVFSCRKDLIDETIPLRNQDG
uniref:Uncharacterized protein n=1 Tax=Panagrolaimus sp. JU765 TaxID=591449 RepID=A0AC34R5D0_9BILA